MKETRGRKPIPDEVKKQRGTFQKCRARQGVPQPAKVTAPPPAPAWLGEVAAQEWRVKVAEAQEMDILAKCDLTLLAALCNEWETYQIAETDLRENGRYYIVRDDDGDVRHAAPKPNVKIAKDALEKYMKLSAEFGFSPQARIGLKVAAKEKPPEDPFAEAIKAMNKTALPNA